MYKGIIVIDKGSFMMDYDDFDGMMNGWDAWPFMWLLYFLVVIVLVLAGFALWKYISKK